MGIRTTSVVEEDSSSESGSEVASSGGDPVEQLGDDVPDHLEIAEEGNEEIGLFLEVQELRQRMEEQTEGVPRLAETVQQMSQRQDRSDKATMNKRKRALMTGISVGFLMGCVAMGSVMMFALIKRK